MNKISRLVKNQTFQRVFYIILFFLINIISLKDGFKSLKSISSLGIQYYYFWIIPSLIILWQIIKNNIVGWLLFSSLYVFYFIWLLYSIFDGIRYDYKEYSIGTFFIFLIIILIYLSFGYFIYLLRPMKKE
jgi:hypothetical protein